MAYACGFPKEVTDLIYSFRDWRYEMVRAGGKTPSAQCFKNLDYDEIDWNPESRYIATMHGTDSLLVVGGDLRLINTFRVETQDLPQAIDYVTVTKYLLMGDVQNLLAYNQSDLWVRPRDYRRLLRRSI